MKAVLSGKGKKAKTDLTEGVWNLRLYVAGQTPKSITAFANLMYRNFNLLETVTEYSFHDGIRVKVFDFWFHFMEKIRFSMVVGVIYRDHKANMTHIALFFDRTDRIAGIFGLQETYLS